MTLTVTVSVPHSIRPHTLVTVTASPVTTEPVTVWRVHRDNTRHRVITTDNPMLIGGAWSGFDDHPPVNQPVTYQATTTTQTSPLSAPVRLVSQRTWLIHRSDSDLSVMVDHYVPPTERVFPAEQVGRFPLLGSGVVSHAVDAPLGGETGTFTCRCDTEAAFDRLRALRADNGPILINRPRADVGAGGWLWVQPSGLTWQNPTGVTAFPYRTAAFAYEATLEPDVDQTAQWSWGQVRALVGTVAGSKARYLTVRDMKLDIRRP